MAEVLKPHRSGVVVAQETDTVEQILDLMVHQSLGSIVVLKESQIVGIFTERDLLLKWRLLSTPSTLNAPISTLMTAPVMTLQISELEKAPGIMYERRIRHIPIVDQRGHLLGIISARDVLAAAAKAAAEEAARHRGTPATGESKFLHLVSPESTLIETLQGLLRPPWQIKMHASVESMLDPTYWLDPTRSGASAFFIDVDGLQAAEWKPLIRQLISLLTKNNQPEVFLVGSSGRVDEKDLESLRAVAKTARWHAYERPIPLAILNEDLRNLSPI